MARRRRGTSNYERDAYKAITGRDAPRSDNLLGMLKHLYGTTRNGNVDARTAAKKLGVSASTIRRWAKGASHPSSRKLGAIRAANTRSIRSRRGRDIDTGRADRLKQQGGRLSLTGDQGVRTPGRDYIRKGYSITYDLSGDAINRIIDAGAAGDLQDLRAAIAEALDEEYVDGWSIDSISRFTID